MTGRSVGERINEHHNDWSNQKEESPLWRHSVEHHDAGTFPIEVKILKRCFGKPTRRMITEAVLVEEVENKESMNNKYEYGYVRIPRVTIE